MVSAYRLNNPRVHGLHQMAGRGCNVSKAAQEDTRCVSSSAGPARLRGTLCLQSLWRISAGKSQATHLRAVDVADAGDDGLVHEDGADGLFSVLDARPHRLPVCILPQRVVPQLCHRLEIIVCRKQSFKFSALRARVVLSSRPRFAIVACTCIVVQVSRSRAQRSKVPAHAGRQAQGVLHKRMQSRQPWRQRVFQGFPRCKGHLPVKQVIATS